uniref:Uncharacterized protein n=1 Tax=Solanum lycopersicum TaxID=4081 RepID=A0A3Q7GYU4_SOLLC
MLCFRDADTFQISLQNYICIPSSLHVFLQYVYITFGIKEDLELLFHKQNKNKVDF